MTQQQQVLQHMEHFGSITPMEAMNYYGIMRLGARIFDLKHEGHLIRTEIAKGENRFGKIITYARYRLVKKHEAAL